MLAIVALWPLGRRGHARTAPVLATARAAIALVVTLLLVSACRSSDPSPIAYGRADCDVCRMRISDNRFGGELVTRTGKVRQFDSIECLANYSVSTTTDVRSAWVSDFDRPGTLIPTATALFVRRTGPSAGMGANLLAVAARSDLASVKSRFGVAPLSWMDIRSLATRGALRALETRGSSSGA